MKCCDKALAFLSTWMKENLCQIKTECMDRLNGQNDKVQCVELGFNILSEMIFQQKA